ncbi:protein of unknown function [Nannocystis exedens]|uniref:Uncharacterized protein n=1 Tax=Nannocystis exedens TaxID=54 RepID=A0A1I2IRA1_9BACT|nr:DUF4150 domain-containing protein [Nannocystis exedens]PCC68208.1 hypothetical protein NAEX_01218 [Nannocystis exedens]SFF44819.1 protein of unknown function [Nannocystis exedens]
MPSTVIVNNLTVVHKASGGSSMAAPDVCKTPTPSGPVLVPYVNTALSRNTAKGSKKVRVDGHPIMLKSSQFSTSSGDEPGTLGGVVSGKTRGKAYPRSYSFDVKVEGQPVFRFTDMMIQNSGSPGNAPGIESQPNTVAAATDASKPELVEMRWSREQLCCGDPVKLSVKTRNADDCQDIQVRVERTNLGQRRPMDAFPVTLRGDAGEVEWISRWRHLYTVTIPAVAVQRTLKGPSDSVNALEFRNPKNLKSQTITGTRVAPIYIEDQATGSWIPAGYDIDWPYAYDFEVSLGRVYVRRKLDFVRGPGVASVPPRLWRRWRAQIEAIWDHKFYFHRKNCKRGKKCDCGVNGCCKYPLRILAVQGTGHGSVKLFLGGPKAQNWGKIDLWWYSDTWWTAIGDAGPDVRAHEFGHLIGCYDEYPAGACEGSRAFADVPDSIMNSGSVVYPRHVEEFRMGFAAHAGSMVGPVKIVRR